MGVSFIRTIVLYVIVVGAMRLMGKRQIGELQPSEFVVAILISELTAIPMQDPGIPLLSGVIPVLTLISCEIVLSSLTLVSPRIRRAISGRPSILILNGQIDQAEMHRLRYTVDDLMEELRLAGYMNVDAIDFAVLETNGKLSVFPKAPEQPLTAGMMHISPPDGGLPVTIVTDGFLLENSLQEAGKDTAWLNTQLGTQHLTLDQVFLLTVDSAGKTILIPKDALRAQKAARPEKDDG